MLTPLRLRTVADWMERNSATIIAVHANDIQVRAAELLRLVPGAEPISRHPDFRRLDYRVEFDGETLVAVDMDVDAYQRWQERP
jgi:hypothetical protein